MDRKIAVPMIVLGLAAMTGTVVHTGSASASNEVWRDEAVQNLSEKLGVEKEKIDAAFDEIKQKRRVERQDQVSAKLDEAVSNGVITAEQKQKILDKQAEHRTQAEKQRAEMEQWLKDNGINSDKLYDYIGRGNGGMNRGGGHRGWGS